MSQKIQLTITDPCHEDWNAMTPAEKGKFCGACQKQVIDFSRMSDRQLFEFFKKPSTGSVCGRFMADQLDRDIEIPKKRIPWLRYFFTIALPAFFLSLKASASKMQGQVKLRNAIAADTSRKNIYDDVRILGMVTKPQEIKPVKSDKVVNLTAKTTEQSNSQSECSKPVIHEPESYKLQGKVITIGHVNQTSVNGIVVNEKGGPVPYATIKVGHRNMIVADENGKFTIPQKYLNKKNSITISSVGYETLMISTEEVTYLNGELQLVLKDNSMLPGVILKPGNIKEYKCSKTDSYSLVGMIGGVSVVRRVAVHSDIERKPKKGENKIHVYPNPVTKGSAFTIEWKEAAEGYYDLHLISTNGQVVYQREIWIDAGAKVLNIQLPLISAGVYFMRIVHKSSGKIFSEKIVIQ